MTATPHSEHERWIEQVLSGERPSAADDLAVCPICTERLRELQAMGRSLDELGAMQREILAEATAPRAARPRSQRAWWIAVAAAAALVLGILFGPFDREPADRLLNANGFRPVGRDVTDDDLLTGGFAWQTEPGGRYVVYLYHAGDNQTPWRTSPECTKSPWRPDAKWIADMRARAQQWTWEVGTIGKPDVTGVPVITRSVPLAFSFSR